MCNKSIVLLSFKKDCFIKNSPFSIFDYHNTATHSISTNPPFGSPATCIVERAG